MDNFLLDAFFKGGPMMWPLLICWLIALGVILERLWCLFRVPDEGQSEMELNEAETLLKNQGEEVLVEHLKQGRGVLNFVSPRLSSATIPLFSRTARISKICARS